jgi:protein gp37
VWCDACVITSHTRSTRTVGTRAAPTFSAKSRQPFASSRPLLGSLYARTRHGRPLNLTGIDWLIAGGESGRNARPVDVRWVRELRDACERARVAFFFKQWGGRTAKVGGRELDGHTFDEMPQASTG